MARAPSPAAFEVAFPSAFLDPQPPIILRFLNQPSAHRILPNIEKLLFEALIRPQHVIEGFFLPRRPRSPERSVHRVGGRSFDSLQDLNHTVCDTAIVAERCQEQMNVVRHDHHGMNLCLRSVIVKTVLQHKMAGRFRNRVAAQGAERYKDGPVFLLVVRQASPVAVLPLQNCLGHCLGAVVVSCGAGAPARITLRKVSVNFCCPSVSVAPTKCDDSRIFRRSPSDWLLPASSRARAPAPHGSWEK